MATRMETRVDSLEKTVGEICGVVKQDSEQLLEVRKAMDKQELAMSALMQMVEKMLREKDPSSAGRLGESVVLSNPEQPASVAAASGSVGDHSGNPSLIPRATSLDELRMAVKKVELPNFDGTDVDGWISKAEQYFEVQAVRPEVKVQLAFVSMEGSAVHWFRCLRTKNPGLTWEMLTAEMIRRYSGRKACNPYECLAAVRQTSTMEQYVVEFETILAQVPNLTAELKLGLFFNGLHDGLKRKIQIHGPSDMTKAIDFARDIEEDLVAEGKLAATLKRKTLVSSGKPYNTSGSGPLGRNSLGRSSFTPSSGNGPDFLASRRPDNHAGNGANSFNRLENTTGPAQSFNTTTRSSQQPNSGTASNFHN